MNVPLVLLLGVAAVAALPYEHEFPGERIIGGSTTDISRYPFSAAMLYSATGLLYLQQCGGTILNQRSILSAAHCFPNPSRPGRHRVRVGSTFASSGGRVISAERVIIHPQYRRNDNDFAIIRLRNNISFNNNIRAGRVAGTNYNLADNQVVWAIGWGVTRHNGSPSERLRHVQVWTINQQMCAQAYSRRGTTITANMLCSGHWGVGGRDQCQGDSGSPLLHNNVVVGVCSFGRQCALPNYPGVNARVSRASQWITNNA